jgi:molecular chaperone GrpE
MNDTPTSSEKPEETAPTDAVFEEGTTFDVSSEPEAESVVEAGETPQDELREANDRALRTQAELENYRRRARREMEDLQRYAGLPLLRDLIPVLDNMQRAIDAAEKAEESSSLLDGLKLVMQQMQSILQQHHCLPIDALGKPFDPNCHEAISQQPSEEHPPGTVMLVAQTGYQLRDRVVRPSQVIVSTAPTE